MRTQAATGKSERCFLELGIILSIREARLLSSCIPRQPRQRWACTSVMATNESSAKMHTQPPAIALSSLLSTRDSVPEFSALVPVQHASHALRFPAGWRVDTHQDARGDPAATVDYIRSRQVYFDGMQTASPPQLFGVLYTSVYIRLPAGRWTAVNVRQGKALLSSGAPSCS